MAVGKGAGGGVYPWRSSEKKMKALRLVAAYRQTAAEATSGGAIWYPAVRTSRFTLLENGKRSEVPFRAQEVALASTKLIEVASDLVGLTDVADIVGVSRQNMRKVMLAHPESFPAPAHEGSASLWHLADVLDWLQPRGSY